MANIEAIDAFCHWAPKSYCQRALAQCQRSLPMLERALAMPVVTDLDVRLELTSEFPGYAQIPSLISPPIESICDGVAAADLAQVANDGMAAMCAASPDDYPSFVASLPLGHIPSALREAKRAVTQLGAAGVQIFTTINGNPIDSPGMFELYALMDALERPIWLHPCLGAGPPDYPGESYSKHELWWALGWPYESSKAMYRLVFAGVFDRWPNLKIITHHGGGVIPMLAGRLDAGLEAYGTRTSYPEESELPIREAPIAAFRRFYADTATFGSAATLACSASFFGTERMVFASDMPFGPEFGCYHIRTSLAGIDTVFEEHEQHAVQAKNVGALFPLR